RGRNVTGVQTCALPILFTAVLVVQRVFYRRPEVHRQRADLYFGQDVHGPADGLDRIFDDEMIGAVTALLRVFDVVALFDHRHVRPAADKLRDDFYVIDELAHDADTRD